MRRVHPLQLLAIITSLLVVSAAFPLAANAVDLELRDDGIWVVDNGEEVLFRSFEDLYGANGWGPKVAKLSPDGEWIAFTRHTGGGFENEGQTAYVARIDGSDELEISSGDYLVTDLMWLEADGEMLVAVQHQSGGTSYRSWIEIVSAETGDVKMCIEGKFYAESWTGARYTPVNYGTPVGFRYEVLGHNEEPLSWGIFYVDQLVEFPLQQAITTTDGTEPSDNPLTDGTVNQAWIAMEGMDSSITINFEQDAGIRGLCIQSGWQSVETAIGMEPIWTDFDLWPMYGRPKNILIGFSDGFAMQVELEDTRSVQWIFFDEGVRLDTITVTIIDSYNGTHFNAVAISEIYTF